MKLAFISIILILISNSFAQQFSSSWIKKVPKSSKISAGYLNIYNDTKTDLELIGAQCDFADAVEIHTHEKVGDVMKMRQLKSLVIKKDETLTLKPGSFHLMLIQLGKKFHNKKKHDITLLFKDGSNKTLSFPIK